ncbi:MAG: hypothetical protein QM778_01975 [Myxococcales bacterium]
MTRSTISLLLTALLSFFAFACGGGRTGSAATMPDGRRIAILVVPDRNLTPDMSPERVEQVNELATWMEGDLIDILNKTGYQATRTEDSSVEAGPGRYVLKIKNLELQRRQQGGAHVRGSLRRGHGQARHALRAHSRRRSARGLG